MTVYFGKAIVGRRGKRKRSVRVEKAGDEKEYRIAFSLYRLRGGLREKRMRHKEVIGTVHAALALYTQHQ